MSHPGPWFIHERSFYDHHSLPETVPRGKEGEGGETQQRRVVEREERGGDVVRGRGVVTGPETVSVQPSYVVHGDRPFLPVVPRPPPPLRPRLYNEEKKRDKGVVRGSPSSKPPVTLPRFLVC